MKLNIEKQPTRPDISGKSQQVDNIPIKFVKTAQLKEGKFYEGKIKTCYINISDEGKEGLILTISLDDGLAEIEFYQALPLKKWNPVSSLLAELEDDLKRDPQPTDLIDYDVQFSIAFNVGKDGKEHCNIKKIEFIYNDDEDDDFDDEDDE